MYLMLYIHIYSCYIFYFADFFIRISEKFRCVGFQDYVMRFITFIRPNQLVCLRLSLYIRMLYFIFWIF
ncbi:hypothetical protein CsatA_008631 [Cannabis sativa]|uniref:Uncharacterized protein n=1 Tax=Cannabis sativa TaxID=3483 RepID=A0A803QYR2_CANSA